MKRRRFHSSTLAALTSPLLVLLETETVVRWQAIVSTVLLQGKSPGNSSFGISSGKSPAKLIHSSGFPGISLDIRHVNRKIPAKSRGMNTFQTIPIGVQLDSSLDRKNPAKHCLRRKSSVRCRRVGILQAFSWNSNVNRKTSGKPIHKSYFHDNFLQSRRRERNVSVKRDLAWPSGYFPGID